ncbi:alginate lyase family protein [Adhaeretor mobilis]|uniref:Chondroitinase-B n=1 Tax=Adhaeretor mobilis TaxID=1930276 RepID=A0A517MYM3_9BACT|nr:alginate lyase family protein [Adhaeretor mobilis]QDS99966.1 Chondroitinase-B precursor [Adhaeretor mobilis]
MHRIPLRCWLALASMGFLACAAQAEDPRTVYWESSHLVATKSRLLKLDEERQPAVLKRLRKSAALALERGPYSVMNKREVPPSGDKHDYQSFSRYWWPNPDTPDGLPYVRRDGETNREIRARGDRDAIGKLVRTIEVLSLAYFFFEQEEYAERAIHLIRTWFLEEETRMNPHLRFGQAVPGRSDGRGVGILDTRGFILLLDSVALLEHSRSFTTKDKQQLQAWFSKYLRWLRESELGREERSAKNNHGSWYDAQTARIAIFVGDRKLAREIVEEVKTKRIPMQFQSDGSQPAEEARTRSLHYSFFNLTALAVVARVGEQFGIDLWQADAPEGVSLSDGLSYLHPYLQSPGNWPHQQIGQFTLSPHVIELLRMASVRLGEPAYLKIVSDAKQRNKEGNYAELLHAAQKAEGVGVPRDNTGRVRIRKGSLLTGDEHSIDSPKELAALLESGKLTPGDTILWASGEYQDIAINIEGIDGTKEQPITLRAATPGGAIFRGASQMRIGTQWWVIEGFHFDGTTGSANSYNPFQFRSLSGTGAQHVRLINCAMTNLTTDEETSKWVLFYGRNNSIEHCHFSGKRSKGALITVELGDLKGDETAEHRIENSYFGDFAYQEGTDNETIRIGSSGDQNKPASCLVQRNLFVGCDGENEVISSKSSHNRVLANTFRQCNGALVLRHGHHARVEGNYFFGDGAQHSGGIRVVDSDHLIINNYLQDLEGDGWNAALSIMGGKQRSTGSSDGYQAVDRIAVMHNTIVNCKRSILLNDEKGSRAPTGTLANNLISSSNGPLISGEFSPSKLVWVRNLLHGASVGASVGAATSDPELSLKHGLLRPSPTGPAANGAVDTPLEQLPELQRDIDGQLRPSTQRDIGADEVSGAQGKITSPPLTPEDVGANFLTGESSHQPNKE